MPKRKQPQPKKDQHPPFNPRMIWGVNSNGVSVVRIPEKSDPAIRRKYINEAKELAFKFSNNNPLYW